MSEKKTQEELEDVEESPEEVDEEVEEEETTEKQAEDKPVEQSTFNKYREAYLKQKLAEMNVEDNEVQSAIDFINERTDGTDSNMTTVMRELQTRMRLDERKSYIDPSSLGGGDTRPRPRGLKGYGRKAYDRVKNKKRQRGRW